MQQLRKQMDTLSEAIMDFKQTADPPVVDAADAKIKTVRTEQTRFTMDGSYERFLVRHIKQARREFREGDRTEPLCSCANPYCNLKRGKLPPDVFLGESTDDGIRDFMLEHDGDGRVLDEARGQWVEDAGQVIQTLTEALSLLKANELPADREDDAADDTSTDTDPADTTAEATP